MSCGFAFAFRHGVSRYLDLTLSKYRAATTTKIAMSKYILIINLYRSNTGVFTPGRHQYQPWDSLTLVYYIQVQQHSVYFQLNS